MRCCLKRLLVICCFSFAFSQLCDNRLLSNRSRCYQSTTCEGYGTLDEADSVFVDVSTNIDQLKRNGTKGSPFQDLIRAYSWAVSSRKSRLIVAVGTYYVTQITLVNGVSIIGGFERSSGFWRRSTNDQTRLVVSHPKAVVAQSISSATVLHSLHIVASDGDERSSSSYALFVVNSNALVIRNCILQAGSGLSPPKLSTVASQAASGSAGGDGASCSRFCSWDRFCVVEGGDGGRNNCPVPGEYRRIRGGGDGGYSYSPGEKGGGVAFGDGGASLNVYSSFSDGKRGGDGVNGTNGANGARFFSSDGYTPTSGHAGTSGTHGSGGGGGGGSNRTKKQGNRCYGPNSGGGGGSGGCGGSGGQGGASAGGSFAVFMWQSPIRIEQCLLITSLGGQGVAGGPGQLGGKGGAGGKGGSSINTDIPVGNGGNGGDGGKGGSGGSGGNGVDGLSVGILMVPLAGRNPALVCNTFQTTKSTSDSRGGSCFTYSPSSSFYRPGSLQQVDCSARTTCSFTCPVSQGNSLRCDSCGICGGDNSTCIGCDGVLGSNKILDGCGVCGGNSSTCTNPCGDGVSLDRCGVCGGDGTSCCSSGQTKDFCGVCGGKNLTCTGCDGVVGSPLRFDVCGMCGGDNRTCIGCDGLMRNTTVDICGVCGGNGSSCVGCDGVLFSWARVDDCGVCAGKNSCFQREAVSQTESSSSDTGAIIGAVLGAVLGFLLLLTLLVLGMYLYRKKQRENQFKSTSLQQVSQMAPTEHSRGEASDRDGSRHSQHEML